MKPRPIDNLKYAQILLLIVKGHNTPKQILKQLNPKKENTVSQSNVSMKLKQLRDNMGFVDNNRLQSINRSSTSRYHIRWDVILESICDVINIPSKIMLHENEQLQTIVKKYFEQIKDIKPLRNLIEDFIIGVARTHNPYEIIKGINLDKSLWNQALNHAAKEIDNPKINLKILQSACYNYIFEPLDNDNSAISESLIDED